MKYVILIPMYGRHELTNMCFEKLAEQRKRLKFFDVIVCGSEGKVSRELTERHGFKYCEFENRPVTAKNNYLMEQARGYDGVIWSGSDNFYTDEQLLAYKNLDLSVCAMYGFRYVLFYSVATKGVYRFTSRPQTVGAGRLYTRPLLEACNYYLWRREANRGMDYIALQTIAPFGEEVWIEGECLDVKHEMNITSHDIIHMSEQIDSNILSNYKIKGLNLLQESNQKQIIMPSKQEEKKVLKVVVNEDIYDFKQGQEVELPYKLAKAAIRDGWCSLPTVEVKEVKPKRTRRATN